MTFHRDPTTHCPKGHLYDRITKSAKPVKWCSRCQKESNQRRAERLQTERRPTQARMS